MSYKQRVFTTVGMEDNQEFEKDETKKTDLGSKEEDLESQGSGTVLSHEDSAGISPSSSDAGHDDIRLIVFLLDGMSSNAKVSERSHEELQKSLKKIRKYWFWEMNLTTHIKVIDWQSLIYARKKELLMPCSTSYSSVPLQGSLGDSETSSTESSKTFSSFLDTDLSNLLCFFDKDLSKNLLVDLVALLNLTMEQFQSVRKTRTAIIF